MSTAQPTYVDKLLQLLVQISEVVPALLVVSDKLLLALQEFHALLLEGFALRALVLNARYHQSVLVVFRIFRLERKEFLDGDEGKLLVCMAVMEKLELGFIFRLPKPRR